MLCEAFIRVDEQLTAMTGAMERNQNFRGDNELNLCSNFFLIEYHGSPFWQMNCLVDYRGRTLRSSPRGFQTGFQTT